VNDVLQTLLNLLADGQLHSGAGLGKQLGISRTAVWKHLQKLEVLGLRVETVKGQGYRLPGGLDLLDRQAILAGLDKETRSKITLELQQSIDSTNTAARVKAEQGVGSGYVVMAEQQTAGRGRRGRTWVSPFARNLYLSLVWEFDQGAAALEGLSLAVGVAVRRAIAKLGVDGAQLKWPNDILCGGSKLGGILLEMIGDPAGSCQVIIGIGLNVDMSDEQTASQTEEISQDWTDLKRVSGRSIARNELACALLNELIALLNNYHQIGFAGIREEWQTYDAFRGQLMCLETPSFKVSGIACGVSDTGAICLDVDGEKHYFNGGEISLRRQQ